MNDVADSILEQLVAQARPGVLQAAQQSYEDAAANIDERDDLHTRLGLPVAATRGHRLVPVDAPGRRLLDELVEPALFDVAVHFLRAVVTDAAADRWDGTLGATSAIADTLMAADLPRRVGLEPAAVRRALATMGRALLDILEAGPATVAFVDRTVELRLAPSSLATPAASV